MTRKLKSLRKQDNAEPTGEENDNSDSRCNAAEDEESD